MGCLLSVDVGLRAGLALFDADGRLVWCRSKNYGSVPALRRHALRLLAETPGLTRLVLEGGGPLAEVWATAAARRSIAVVRVVAEEWRAWLLPPRERATGVRAKRFAAVRARALIEASGARRPTSLRHDAAEAILAGAFVLARDPRPPAAP